MSQTHQLRYTLAALIALIVIAILPTPYKQVLSYGTDSYETHKVLAGTDKLQQTVTPERTISGIGALAVDFKRSGSLAPLVVKVTNASEDELARAIINPDQIADDELAWARFASGSIPAGEPINIVLSAPEATGANPYGVRFDAGTKHLAIGMIESIPVWEQIGRWKTAHPRLSRLVFSMLVAAIGLALLGSRKVELLLDRPWVFPAALGILAVVAILLRLPTAAALDSLFGGDAFNYVMKSRAWIEGADPFAIDPRKAPLMSLLLLPGLSLLDPLVMGQAIGIISAAIGAVLLALIARRLELPKALALAAAALLVVNRYWWWESVTGLANIPYVVLLLAATLAFLAARPYLVGVLAGLATLTRYEGALALATLLPSMWVLTPRWRTMWRSVLPALILIGLPLALWPLTGNSGVRTTSDLLGDQGLYIAWDWHDYVSNLQRFRIFVGRMWFLQGLVGNQLTLFISGLVASLLLTTRKQWPPALATTVAFVPFAAAAALLGFVGYGNQELLKLALTGLTATIGLGLGYLLLRQPRRTIPIALMVLAQVLFVTAILPKDRYYIIVVPFAALFLAVGVISLVNWQRPWQKVGVLLTLGAVLGMTYANTTTSLSGQISEYNDKSGPATELVNVGKYLRQHPGRVGAPRYADLFLRVYRSPNTVTLLPTEKSMVAADELQRLRNADVHYVVSVKSGQNLVSLDTFPQAFELEADLTDAKIYRLLPE